MKKKINLDFVDIGIVWTSIQDFVSVDGRLKPNWTKIVGSEVAANVQQNPI